MATTRIQEGLYHRIKALAKAEDRTTGNMINRLLRQALETHTTPITDNATIIVNGETYKVKDVHENYRKLSETQVKDSLTPPYPSETTRETEEPHVVYEETAIPQLKHDPAQMAEIKQYKPMVKKAPKVKELFKYCKNGHPMPHGRDKCLQKDCKYSK